MNVVGYDTEHDQDERLAREIVNDLAEAYPGHGWFVLIRGGMVQIRNNDWSGVWGMCLPYAAVTGDAKVRKALVVRFAGEFLERAHQRRGGKTEEIVTSIEGIPDKWMHP